jgi:hypothetical protein
LAGLYLGGCGGGGEHSPSPPPPPTTYTAASGVAQKGPLILGSTVTAQELSARLSATGKQYSYQTNSDLGTFNPNSTFTSQYVGLIATGYYFDEIANATSGGTVTLNGYADLLAVSVLNVNLLTTLAYQRIQNLVNQGINFAQAQTQAESEVLAALNIRNGASYGHFNTFDIGKSADGDKILTAISALFVFGNTSGNLSALIAAFQNDIGAHGVITNAATNTTLAASAKALNPAMVAANLTQKYASIGVTFAATDIANWIDQDGDGVVGKFKFQVAEASQASIFTFPSSVTDPYAGTSISASVGQLTVNGTPISGATTIKAGDVVVVSPPPGQFPNGVQTAYLLSGSNRIARVSFVNGLTSVAVTPANPTLGKGATQQLTATGTFTDGSQADLTASVSWNSGTPTVATVNATSGLATAIAIGTASITASSGSTSGSTAITVGPATLQSIALTPDPLTVGVGIARKFIATGTNSDGTTAGDVTASATWTTSSSSVATVTGGFVTGHSLGATSVAATLGAVSGSAQVNVATNVWLLTGNMVEPRTKHTATLLPNGKVLVTGGTLQFSTVVRTAEIYDPDTDSWSPAALMANSRTSHTASLLPSGKVLIAGGFDSLGAALASAEIYDPGTDTWSPAGIMANARASHTATLLPSGKVLIAGGGEGAGYNQPGLTSAEIYDPGTNSWSGAASLANGRESHTATPLSNGKVLVAGGIAAPGGVVVASAEIYDPGSNTWSSAGTLAYPVYLHTATLLPDGKVLVAGGAVNPSPMGYTRSAELYDPVANAWSSTGSMIDWRYWHAAALLPSGKVIVTGGFIADHPDPWCEVYDPASGTWSSVASMNSARELHTATLLLNGALLVVGDPGAELYW